MRKQQNQKQIVIIGTILTIMLSLWSMQSQLPTSDPKIKQKYKQATLDLKQIKNATIIFYCKHSTFPDSLDELVPNMLKELPRDPWGNMYIITSLAWRIKGSGKDILSMGADGKRSGKGWKRDIITRVDLKNLDCNETNI